MARNFPSDDDAIEGKYGRNTFSVIMYQMKAKREPLDSPAITCSKVWASKWSLRRKKEKSTKIEVIDDDVRGGGKTKARRIDDT